MLRNPPWEVSGLNNILDTSDLGLNARKTSTLCWLENQRDLQERYKKLRLCSQRAYTCFFTPGNKTEEADWTRQIETEWGSGRFPMTVPTCTHPQYTLTSAPLALVQLPTRAKDVIAEECTLVGGSEPAQIWHCTWMGCGHSLLVFAEMVDWKMSGALTLMPEPFQCMSQPTPGTHSCPSCFNAVPLRGKGVVGMGEYAHLVRMEPARTRTSGVLLQPFGTNRCSW